MSNFIKQVVNIVSSHLFKKSFSRRLSKYHLIDQIHTEDGFAHVTELLSIDEMLKNQKMKMILWLCQT